MKKNISRLLAVVLGVFLLFDCGNDETQQQSSSDDEIQQMEQKTAEKLVEEKDKKVVVESMGHSFTYENVPKKIFTNELNLLEILIELELTDKIAGYAGGHYTSEMAMEKNREILKDLNYIGDYVSLESVVNSGADFIYINPTSFSDRIDVEEFIDRGIKVYGCRTNYVKAADIDDVYADILNLGNIFRIEDKAKKIVTEMKAEQEEITKNVDTAKRPRILVYDFGDADVFTAGSGLESSLISLAGGENIFSDVKTPWGKVSWEEIVDRNPEIIIIHEYSDSDEFETKKKFLLNNEILKDVDAIKNQNFIQLPMIHVFTGMQINEGIRLINQGINDMTK